ncbi:MAG: hypothetical protein U5K84_09940 [Alkalibacterium sp.]|nr:hypothetical protein [Alkalibacterium sp.]
MEQHPSEGGAYGSLYQHRRNGNLALGSYRDPNIGKTLDVYQNMPDYIKGLTLSESELLKYIIGTLSPLEQPKSAHSKGLTAFNRLKRNITKEDIVQLKEEILATDSDKLASLHDDFKAVIEAVDRRGHRQQGQDRKRKRPVRQSLRALLVKSFINRSEAVTGF